MNLVDTNCTMLPVYILCKLNNFNIIIIDIIIK